MEDIKKPNTIVLPSNFEKLKSFSENKKYELIDYTIDTINYALANNLPTVELFKFNNSEYSITLFNYQFKENLDHIFSECMKFEKYELCPKINSVRDKLLKHENTKKA